MENTEPTEELAVERRENEKEAALKLGQQKGRKRDYIELVQVTWGGSFLGVKKIKVQSTLTCEARSSFIIGVKKGLRKENKMCKNGQKMAYKMSY